MLKKIDLHIHTIKTEYDNAELNFEHSVLSEYIKNNNLDAIAITNHNVFNREQYDEICDNNKNKIIFPGIEITIDDGHLLVISPPELIDEFSKSCKKLDGKPTSVVNFLKFFSNVGDYLLIPHYGKTPEIKPETFEILHEHFKWVEVASPKKFEIFKKNGNFTPLLFSDARIGLIKGETPTKATFIGINEISIKSLKHCFSEKTKVHISPSKKDDEFQLGGEIPTVSTKLNVIIGKRSSGKTHVLETILKSFNSKETKYIKQFQITGSSVEKKFIENVKNDNDFQSNNYLSPIKNIISDIINIDCCLEKNKIEEYLSSLSENARTNAINDAFSNANLFKPNNYTILKNIETESLIKAIETILTSKNNEEEISKWIELTLMKKMIVFFAKKYRLEELQNKLKQTVNEIANKIRSELSLKSCVTPIVNINFCEICRNIILVTKFNKVVNALKKESLIKEIEHGRFTIKISKKPYKNISEVKRNADFHEKRNSFSENVKVFEKYNDPYEYISLVNKFYQVTDIEKTLFNIEYTVTNECGENISGGERAEFVFIKELESAEKYEVVLLDEPEASFDNIFLKECITKTLKELSNKTTVFITTHNNTLGVSISPNKIIYCLVNNGKHKLYGGELTDKELKTQTDLDRILTHDVLMDTMEAGKDTYTARKEVYEITEN